jgi:FkbM family methyltransferase
MTVKNALDRLVERLPDPLFYWLLARQYRMQEPELRQVPVIVPQSLPAIDVGAWWGPWTYWLSRWVPQVIAVEPQPRLAAFLERVAGANVKVVNAALSDAPGSVTLTVPSARRGQDALASVEPGIEGETMTVPAHRIDDLAADGNFGFIKIDVEGHELAVLRGAEKVIERCTPALLIEIEQRHLRHPIEQNFQAVARLGYVGYFWLGKHWHPLDAFDVEAHQLAVIDDRKSGRYVNNFLFVAKTDETLRQRLLES